MSTNVLPVTIKEFTSIAQRLWQRKGSAQPQKIGLAISGGVDSMALASLVLRSTPPEASKSITAFIVDHKIRPESTDEAHKIKSTLRDMGLECEILTSTTVTDFHSHMERKARTIRYRLLGKACRARGIDTLLFAHHGDDQAETILTRILSQYYGRGLLGIKETAVIPESNDLHGVTLSGSPRQLKQQSTFPPIKQHPYETLITEAGGVTIMRPLLAFTKKQLIATCVSQSIEWAEDITNADVSVATRNAIRHLQETDVLPQALRTQRLLHIAEKIRTAISGVEIHASGLLQSSDVKLDTNFGQLMCRFPQAAIDPLRKSGDINNVRRHLLAALVDMVSPLSVTSVGASVAVQDFLSDTDPTEPVWIISNVSVETSRDGDGTYSYHLARTNGLMLQDWTISKEEVNNVGKLATWSRWHLVDNRYWMRLGHRNGLPGLPEGTSVRLLKHGDLSRRQYRLTKLYRDIRRQHNVSSRSLYCIPVIVVDNKVAAIPSLGINLDKRWCTYPSQLSQNAEYFYNIRYRAVRPELTEEIP